jgi:hypothetical protein
LSANCRRRCSHGRRRSDSAIARRRTHRLDDLSAARALVQSGRRAACDAHAGRGRAWLERTGREPRVLAAALRPRACGGDDRLDLFLTRGLGSAYTAAISDDPTTFNDDWSTYIAIDPSLSGSLPRSTTVHELNHALQAADDWWEILTTLESTATLMEEYIYDDVNSYLPTLPSFQNTMLSRTN